MICDKTRISNATPTVFIIDGNEARRSALEALVRSVRLSAKLFDTAEDFLDLELVETAGCLVTEVRLRGISGLALQRRLAEQKCQISIVFLTACGDVQMAVRAMKAGAVDFIDTSSSRDQDVLEAIHLALARDHARCMREAEISLHKERLASLTVRQREILGLVVSGMLNKQIAGRLGIAENTVKVHRSRAINGMQAQSFADLVKMFERVKSLRPVLPPSGSDKGNPEINSPEQRLYPNF
jgi:FixJ family two-component response regulator